MFIGHKLLLLDYDKLCYCTKFQINLLKNFAKIAGFGEKYTEIVSLQVLTGKFSNINSKLISAAMAIPVISYQNWAIDIDDTFDKGSNNLDRG
ncbi:hypothetical protein HZH66_013400 [Vespula vulgaris]|uniref:Uncharacterized protein n=1 Tax=Vespula vulgaris TaxID=7454 RepID=A0A834MU25_VESVU|nr:hypothetical protein HZH66_013400 [Vespula vulgaris]